MPNGPPPRLQLSVIQVVTAALSAVSAAAIASRLGVGGTLLGAAVTSVVATVASALYAHSLDQARTHLRLRRNPRTGRLQRVWVPLVTRLPWGRVAGWAALVF